MPIHDWTRVQAGIFHHFHHEWTSTICRKLNDGLLPPGYYALAEQIAGGMHPDVLGLESRPNENANEDRNGLTGTPTQGGGIVALATTPPRVRFTAVAEMDQYATNSKRIAIRHSGGDKVVALLEIVSPGNKASKQMLRAFVDKALEFLHAGVHLLILDLFPPGPRDPQGIHSCIWSEIQDNGFQLPADKPLTLVAYSAGYVKSAYIDPVAVGETLPVMPLFLEPERYVPVPLEPTYQAAWEAVPQRWRDVLEPPSS
jgi:hypothetical protein